MRRMDRRFFARNAAALTRTSATWRDIYASSAALGPDFSVGIARSDSSTVIICGTIRGSTSTPTAATSCVTETSLSQLKLLTSPTSYPVSLFICSVICAFIKLFIRQSVEGDAICDPLSTKKYWKQLFIILPRCKLV